MEYQLVDATIDFRGYDYYINGKPLHPLVSKGQKVGGPDNFGINGTSHYSSAVISQPKAVDRLMGVDKPDLIHGLTALYVCGHCGGYDGTLIGAHIEFYGDSVFWCNIGMTSDAIELNPKHIPFNHIPSFCFKRSEYNSFIIRAREFEIDNG